MKDDTLGHPTDYEWSNLCVLVVLSSHDNYGFFCSGGDIGNKVVKCGECLNKPNKSNCLAGVMLKPGFTNAVLVKVKTQIF